MGVDKGYEVHEFVSELRHMAITPHIAQNDTNRRSAVRIRTSSLIMQNKPHRIQFIDSIHVARGANVKIHF